MSIILAIGTANIIYVATDGRCIWEDNKGRKLIQEDYQKFIVCADDTCIAFAGNTCHCIPILEKLKELIQNHNKQGIEEYTAFCASAAQNLGKLDPTTNAQFLIAGKKKNGKLGIGVAAYFQDECENEIVDCVEGEIRYAVRSCLDPNETFVNETLQFSPGPIENRVQKCIEIAATKSDQINTRVFDHYVRF